MIERRLCLDGNADMPALVRASPRSATDRTVADQFDQLVARFDAAGPGPRARDAHLVELGRIDAVEPVGHAGHLDGAAVLDDRAGSPTLPRPENCEYQDQGTHPGHCLFWVLRNLWQTLREVRALIEGPVGHRRPPAAPKLGIT